MKIIFNNATILSGPVCEPYTATILVEDGIIKKISKDKRWIQEVKNIEDVYDCSNYLVTPGFINGHIHLNQLLNRAILDEKSTEDLFKSMHSNHYKKNNEDRYWASLLSISEGFESGTTFYSAFATSTSTIADAMVDAVLISVQ